jgi:hypothetical protein
LSGCCLSSIRSSLVPLGSSRSAAAPVVSSAARGNMVLSGGAFVTVAGLNFVGANLTASVSIRGDISSTSQWTSATTVQARLSPSSKMESSSRLLIGSPVGTNTAFFSFDGTGRFPHGSFSDGAFQHHSLATDCIDLHHLSLLHMAFCKWLMMQCSCRCMSETESTST